MEHLVEAAHLSRSFGALHAVEDVSLMVSAGEIYGLVGSDGAGKTTTLRLLIGALRLDEGKVRLCGYDLSVKLDQARARVGYLSQRFSMYEDLTVLENIRFFAEMRGLKASQWLPRCMEILEFVGLAEYKTRRAGKLSGGMKQKLGLASALVSQPSVLLLDEPTTGVDPVTRQDFWQLIIRLASRGEVAIIITTPYMDEASRCHRIGFMRLGQIIAEGKPSELRSILNGRIMELRGQPLVLLRRVAEQVKGIEDARLFGDRLHLRVRKGDEEAVLQDLPALVESRGGSLSELIAVPPTLEDVFIYLSQT